MKRAIATSAIVLTLAGAQSAAAATKNYVGKTDQGAKVTFQVKGKKVRGLDSVVAVSCTSPQTSYPRGGADRYLHPGRFRLGSAAKASERQPSAVAYGEPTKNYTTKTRRRGTKIVGELSFNFSYYEPDLYYPKTWFCTGVADFKASPV